MSSRLVLRPAVLADAAELAPRLREADRLELTLSAGPDILQTLEDSLSSPGENLAATLDGVVVALGGCAFHDDVGVPWMVTSADLTSRPITLVRLGLFAIERYAPKCRVLTNFVHALNHVHIKWLERIGFTLGDTTPDYGVGKAPFIQFYRYSQCVTP